MKKLLLLLFLFPSFLVAQNWSPLNSYEAFNFRLDNDAVITSTIKSNSFTATVTDTTFTLNTIMCDSCITIVGGPIPGCDSCYGWKNKPQFFGREASVTNSGWCNFRDPINQVINLYAVVNDVWVFDTAANVTATVVASALSTVMGFPDSVKTVLLSTGDTILFSKNYGIVQWPNGYGQNSYYRLQGIHGRNIGVLVPRTMDYFNFAIGDMFEYHGQEEHGWSPQKVIYVRQYEIMNKVISGDTVTYSVDSYEVDTNYFPVSFPPTTTITFSGLQHYNLIFIDSADHLGNKFNNQLISQWNRIYSGINPWAVQAWTAPEELSDTCYYRCNLFQDSLHLQSIQFGSISDYSSFYGEPFYSGSAVPNALSDTLMPVTMANSFNYYSTEGATIILTEGLGQTFVNWSSHFEQAWGEKLWAYRERNDTVGTFTSKLLFDGISEQPLRLPIYVFPNPSNGTINVQIPANTIADITILDLQGRVVKTFSKQTGSIVLDANDLAVGIYMLDARSPMGNSQQKIIIRR
ncbi:hypothetical protein BH11BAC7_BH11BAC7_05530 [soil metagenome]